MRRGIRVTCISDNGEQAVFANSFPLSLFWLDDIDGIDGLENTNNTTKGNKQAGETFVGSTPNMRRLEITGKLMSDTHDNRQTLFRAFNVNYGGRLVYEYGDYSAHILYRVKKAPKFSVSTPEEFTIILDCPNPYFNDGDGARNEWVEIAGWIGGLEFDFEIPEDGIGFEERSQSLIKTVFNTGDYESGLKIEFTAIAAASNPSIVNVGLQKKIELEIDMQTGDVITVNTTRGSKKATLKREGIETNIVNLITDDSDWLQMQPGDNLLRYNADPIENVDVRILFKRPIGGL